VPPDQRPATPAEMAEMTAIIVEAATTFAKAQTAADAKRRAD
jgi:hypothetical protein